MKILSAGNHQLHHPLIQFFNGVPQPHIEIPNRVENILAALKKTKHEILPVSQITQRSALLDVLSHIHDPEYITWIQNFHPTEPLFPSMNAQWKTFVTDTYTPLLPNTWNAAFTMAEACYQAAKETVNHSIITVIGRPPGHHAGKSKVGGFCYINNAAVTAQKLSERGTVAILDIDYHHGNGTQDIFYHRNDVITCSIHADPKREFPYITGFAHEKGKREGYGYNKNYPLPAAMTNRAYQHILESALEWLVVHKPRFLVVSLGLDTHESDPISDFQLTTKYYKKMAKTINQLNLPTVIVLEGGYNTETIGANMVSFLSGFDNTT